MTPDPTPRSSLGETAGAVPPGADRTTFQVRLARRLLNAFLALSTPVLLTACGGSEALANAEEEPAETAIFVYDRSGSVANYKLGMAEGLTGNLLHDLDHGDRIVAMQLLEASLEEPPIRWSQRVPLREYPGERVASDSLARTRFLRDARDYMRRFTDTLSREPVNGTDILSTLYDVAADLRAHPEHRTTLYLFSDMLQANARLNFEAPGRRPPEGWVKAAVDSGTLPDLSGLCVVVVGARVDSRRAQAVKRFWQEYFTAAKARLLDHNYTLRPVRLPPTPCG